ncbi:LysR family transcriptional regulator [Alcaligenaceae bacterium]|nr:LysR family transcriptional regulator [Alcaligenaceae bacterium]
MELRQLKQFVTVAQTQSFSRAAERLFMAQPPLSVAIRKLEEEVGVALFERGSRGVKLTPAGHAALAAAQRCLDGAQAVIQAAQSAADGERGLLRVGFIGSLNFSLLPQLIKEFSQRYPNIRMELSESTNHGLISMLESDALDVAFLREPTTHPTYLAFETIADDAFCIALPADHPLVFKSSLTLRDLQDQDLIGYTPSRVGGLNAAMMSLLHTAGISVHITQEAVQVQTVVGLVRSGLGIALVPSINASIMLSDVVFRPIKNLPASAKIGIAVAHRNNDNSPTLLRFKNSILSKHNSLIEHGIFTQSTTRNISKIQD